MRSRDVPGGTVGGRIAGTKMRRFNSSSETPSARSSLPRRTETIGPSTARSTARRRAARRRAAFARRRSRRSSPRRVSRSAMRDASTSDGGSAVSKINERARLTSSSIAVAGPQRNRQASQAPSRASRGSGCADRRARERGPRLAVRRCRARALHRAAGRLALANIRGARRGSIASPSMPKIDSLTTSKLLDARVGGSVACS